MNKCLLIFLLLCSPNAFSVVNKWVDKNGNVHYSDQPLPANAKANELNIAPSPVSAGEAQEKRQQYTREIEKSQEQKIAAEKQAQAEAKAKAEARAKTKQNQQCNNAIDLSENLQKTDRVFYIKNGKRVRMNATQKQAQIDKNENYINTNCD